MSKTEASVILEPVGPKEKIVQIATETDRLFALTSEGRLFSRLIAGEKWHELALPDFEKRK